MNRSPTWPGWVVAFVSLGLFAACNKDSGTRVVEQSSLQLDTPEKRVKALCAVAMCRSQPTDTAFRSVLHDNSGGLLPGPSDFTFSAAVKTAPNDGERWVFGCTRTPADPRPDWVKPLLAERGWANELGGELPDGYSCGANDTRLVYVKSGFLLWHVETR